MPDVDRTDHLVILGANPLVSNGSLLTAPDMRRRLRQIRERGGKVVVVDPRHTLFDESLADPGPLRPHMVGLGEVEALARDFAPEAVSGACGLEPADIRRMARELAAARRAAVYGRIGACTQEFGGLASRLVDVLNAVTGNVDREGGAMFTLAAAGQRNSSGAPGSGRGFAVGRWTSRVRGLAEEPLARLAGIVSGQGTRTDLDALDDLVIATVMRRDPVPGREEGELLAELEGRRGRERILEQQRAEPQRPGGPVSGNAVLNGIPVEVEAAVA